MPQQTRDSECHCCLTVKHNYTSNLYLLFHWYCERGGDSDESLTWRRDLINLFSPKDVYRRALFFVLALCARSRAFASLASSPMFSKRTKRKIKQRLCTG